MSSAHSKVTIEGRTSRWTVVRRRGGGALVGLVAGLCFQMAALPASGATQEIRLRAGWNLISLNVEPVDPRVEAVVARLEAEANFRSIWAYDAATGTWATHPPRAGDAPLTTLGPGIGYWLRVHRDTPLGAPWEIEGTDNIARSAAPDLQPGWNLIGFVTDEPKGYDRALQGVPFDQLWTFISGGFKGVVFGQKNNQRVVEKEDTEVLNVEPGRGYWMWFTGDPDLSPKPELGTTLPPDLDVEPFVCGVTPCEERTVWGDLSPGDRNIGREIVPGDIYYDLSDTQRAVDFGDFTSSQTLGIFNRGPGVLSWRVAIDAPDAASWLSFRVTGEIPSDDQLLTELSGSVATESAAIELFVDRRGLGPGTYPAKIIIESNGDPDREPVRTIAVSMKVPPLDGDYRVETRLETVNGEPAELHNPRLFLSVYRDTDGLKGILDGERTLLIPERCVGDDPNGLACKDNAGAAVSCNGRACSGDGDCGQGRCEHYVRLAGRIYQDKTNRFILSGSFELPQGAEDNPYQADLRRDITLIGDRPKAGDTNLGPQDLTGTYHETIRNVLGDPIRLSGTFRASRVNALPTSRDEGGLVQPLNLPIPNDGTSLIPVPEIVVTDNLLLSEVDVRVDINHPQPVRLTITIEAPSGKKLTLRKDSSAPAGDVTYDETQQPYHSLDELVGELSAGTWKLDVRDSGPGVPQNLRSWELFLKGTRVNDIRGTVQGAGEWADECKQDRRLCVRVLLSGCGRSEIAIADAEGNYVFENLIDCPYRLTVHHPTFGQATRDVTLHGEDLDDIALAPESRQPPTAREEGLPEGTQCRIDRGSEPCDAPTREAACGFTSLTTSGGAGVYHQGTDSQGTPTLAPIQSGRLQYAVDSANFDIDRPPYSPSCGSWPGSEDSNCFISDIIAPILKIRVKNCGAGGGIDLAHPDARCPLPQQGPCEAVRAQVALGMPVIGYAVAGNLTMSIGANP